MKKAFLITGILLTMAFTSVNAQTGTSAGMPAQAVPSSSSGMGGGMMGGNHPCKKLMEACKSAGFVKGNLMKDCMKPLLAGQTVSGISVSSSDIQACQAKRSQHGM